MLNNCSARKGCGTSAIKVRPAQTHALHAGRRHLGMYNAFARRHPLQVTRTNLATVAAKVLVLKLALELVRQGK